MFEQILSFVDPVIRILALGLFILGLKYGEDGIAQSNSTLAAMFLWLTTM